MNQTLDHFTTSKATLQPAGSYTAMNNSHHTTPHTVTPDDTAAEGGKESFIDILNRVALTGTDFMGRGFPARPEVMGDWFREGDLGFVFAPRGIGKSWFAHAIIASLTSGRDLDEWHVPRPFHVGLLDGEMPPDAVQERLKTLDVNPDNLTVLHHQILYDEAERSFQLGDPEHRRALLTFCISTRMEVLVIDNLSSLSNISENDNDEWMEIGDWLLEFRRNHIAVIVVHHAGRNGQMRGASRREDPAFWVIRLDDSKERTSTSEGARFVSTFTKNRNARTTPTSIDWHFSPNADGVTEIIAEAADNDTLVLHEIKGGMTSATEIAEELGIGKGTVSKAAKRLEGQGCIRIEGRDYLPN